MRFLLLALLLQVAGHTLGAQTTCADPTPADSGWWRWQRRPSTGGAVVLEAPKAPPQPDSFQLASLRGTYVLTMVHTVGPEQGQRIIANVELESDSSGTAIARESWPAVLTLAPDHKNRQPITILFNRASRRLSLVIGNPGLSWTDAGVSLEVFSVSRHAIIGRWVDGGLGVSKQSGLHPQGWFCLTRPA